MRTGTRGGLLALCVLAVLGACSKTPETAATLVPVDTTLDVGALVSSLPDPDAQGGHVGRAPRRLTVAQLDQSIRVATGQTWAALPGLAGSLGQADYALVNTEAADPNLVFAKFLDDGARTVCGLAGKADLTQTTAANRVLAQALPDAIPDLTAVSEADVRKNLAYLSLRFWGQELQGAELDRWTLFFQRAATAGKAKGGLRDQVLAATCIALITDPRFLSY